MYSSRHSIYDITYQDLQELIITWQEENYRAEQVWKGVYQNFYTSFDDFSNIPFQLKKRLSNHFTFTNLIPTDILFSKDNQTKKQVFQMQDGCVIETVIMEYDKRTSICISSQSGCGMGCKFCATGQMGYVRNLSCGEMIEQVLHFEKKLRSIGQNINNIVIMGMGEPFQNYDATMQAITTLNHAYGLNFGERRFTISSVGLIPAIIKFSNEQRQINLAISLHAANDELRSQLIPLNKKYPVTQLLEACKYYIKKTGRRISFEWAMIDHLNDTPDQAHLLVNLIKNLLCHVNLIPLNRIINKDYYPSSSDRIRNFKNILFNSGISCSIRMKRGLDIAAGCGQLANKNHNNDDNIVKVKTWELE